MVKISRKKLVASIRLFYNTCNLSNLNDNKTQLITTPLQRFCIEQKKRDLIAFAHPSQIVDANFQLINNLPNVLYAGFDPTSNSLHIGNLLILTSLLRSIQFGCQAIVLIGSSTASVGDPSGRQIERDFLESDTIRLNAIQIHSQISHIFSNFSEMYPNIAYKLEIVDNMEWYSKMSLGEFLNICRLFRVSEMLRTGAIKSKFRDNFGVNCSEFLYQIFQTFDWYTLSEKFHCFFQIGGSDQLGHLDIGCDYIMRRSGKNSAGLCLPLLTDAAGNKLGKSLSNIGGNIWLNERKTSSYAFYQFFQQKPDKEIVALFRQFSLRPFEEIEAILVHHSNNLGQWIAQKELATELTRLVHGQRGLEIAEQCSNAIFHDNLDGLLNLPASTIENLFGEASSFHLSRSKIKNFGDLANQCRRDKFYGSVLMKEGALKLNGKRYTDPKRSIDFSEINFGGKNLTIVCWGKRKYSLIRWSE